MAGLAKKIKKALRKKFIIFLLITSMVVVGLFFYLSKVVNPVIIETSRAKVKALSQQCVESVVYEVIKENNIYDNLVRITRDTSGKVVSVSTNSAEINILARDLTSRAQKKFENLGALGVNIPLGSFTGLPILTGRGPKINIKLVPIGTIRCSFKSEFTSAGINQTNHRIYLSATSSVSIIMPTANQKITTTTDIMVSESIIVGEIPDVYVNGEQCMEYLDLMP